MNEMYTNINDNEELLFAIEGVYAEFGYPVDMVPFIYYMPSEDQTAKEPLNPQQARARLVVKLSAFLIQEGLIIESGCDTLPEKIY